MTLEVKALIDWYQHQYDVTKASLQENCSQEWFWTDNAEEQLIQKLVYMTQLRNMIEGLKKGSE